MTAYIVSMQSADHEKSTVYCGINGLRQSHNQDLQDEDAGERDRKRGS